MSCVDTFIRAAHEKKAILKFTSNARLDKVSKIIDEGTFSRLASLVTQVDVTGIDRRCNKD
jgi:hypothetical protein